MADQEKWLWIVTGPNGAGKSTLWNSLGDEALKQLPYFNPDEEAKKAMNASRPEEGLTPEMAYKKAFTEQEVRAESFHAQGQSYAFEKASPGRRTFALVKKLKDEGWKIGVIAVGVATPELAAERIKGREEEGGHPENIASSLLYQGCLANTPKLIGLADKARLYDNTGGGFQEIARRDAPGTPMTMVADEGAIDSGNSYMRQMLTGLRQQGLLAEAGRNF